MSISNLNIQISSSIGYNVVGGGIILGHAPQLQTVKTLDGTLYDTSTNYTLLSSPLLDINVLDDFQSVVGIASDQQTVSMTNNGNYELNVIDVLYTYNQNVGVYGVFPSDNSVLYGKTIQIAPGDTSTFKLSYISDQAGIYYNQIYLISNSNGGIHKINTRQIVRETSGLRITPTSFTTTTTHLGQTREIVYDIIPIKNEVERPDIIFPVYTLLKGGSEWYITNNDNNKVTLKFNSNEVNNVNGTYISTLTMQVNGFIYTATNTATVLVNYALTKNLGTWLSEGAIHNSIVGMSYDLESGDRYLTIGIGAGGNNSPLYDAGGDLLLDIESLGYTGESVSTPFPFWAEVYKIKFTGNNQTYLSKDYLIKTTEGIDFSGYFGDNAQTGSVFIIEDDGYGSLSIKLNNLRTLSEDTGVNVTLNNLTQSFYYSAAPSAVVTNMFIGFNYNTRDKIALVKTSVVPVPV